MDSRLRGNDYLYLGGMRDGSENVAALPAFAGAGSASQSREAGGCVRAGWDARDTLRRRSLS